VQKFAGSMMIPIILLVFAGILIGVGSAFVNMENVRVLHLDWLIQEGNLFYVFFSILSDLGFLVLNFLPAFFAVGLAFGLARKDKGWAALGGLVFFLGMNTVISTMMTANGITPESTTIESLMNSGLTELEAQNYNSLFAEVLGVFTFDMGIFSGILSGLIVSLIHNKFCDTQLPNALSFFSGPRSVQFIIFIAVIPFGMLMYYVWPTVGIGIGKISNFITTSGLIGSFTFGILDRGLLPLGLHHLIAFPIEYTEVGGTLEVGDKVYQGVRNIMLAQMGSPDETGYITRNFTTGKVLFHFGGLPGAALAMYHTAKSINKKKAASILIPATVTAFLVGITEPIEYTFLFVQPLLFFLIHVPMSGLSYVLTEAFNISIEGVAVRDMFANLLQPGKVHNFMILILLIVIYFIVYYVLFRWAILKFNIKTPGRGDSDEEVKLYTKKDYHKENIPDSEKSLEKNIIDALGGETNIVELTNCATRLRIKVLDESK